MEQLYILYKKVKAFLIYFLFYPDLVINSYYIITTSSMIALKVLLSFFHITQPAEELNDLEIISLVEKILIKIHPTLFLGIKNFDFTKMNKQQIFLEIISLVGNYLNFKEYKRLNKDFQKAILKRMDLNNLLGLVLYISINSEIKDDVIELILSFDEDQQQQIMKIVQEIDSQCEDLLELKKAIHRIGMMEQENDLLRQKIRCKLGQSQGELHKLKEIETQNALLLKQLKKYKDQKKVVFSHFKINNISEYLDICNEMKQKNIAIEQNIQELQTYRIALVSSNINIKQQLKKNGKTIQNQIQSIQSLKKMCKELDFNRFNQLQNNHETTMNLPLLPLQENNNIKNIKKGLLHSQRQKLETDRTACSLQRQEMQEQQQKKNNLERLLTLKQLQLQQKEKIELIINLKQNFKLQLVRERKIRQKKRRLMEQHTKYMQTYQSLQMHFTTRIC